MKKVHLILSALAVLFVVGSSFTLYGPKDLPKKGLCDGLDIVLEGEVGRETSRSALIIPIEAALSIDNTVHVLFLKPLGNVQILVNGQVRDLCQVTMEEQETSFSVEDLAPGIYKIEFKAPQGVDLCGEFEIKK